MKKITIIISVLFASYSIAQTIDKLDNTEIENLKKAYFQNLRTNQDARVFSINKQRKIYVYKKLTNKQTTAATTFILDSIKRNIFRKNILYDLKVKKSNHNESLANTIGYRRVNSVFDKMNKEEKKKRLESANKAEITNRQRTKKDKIKAQKKQLENKIETRYELLKKKYAIPKKEKTLQKKE